MPTRTAALPGRANYAGPRIGAGRLAGGVVLDALWLLVMVAAVPACILAVGVPLAGLVRLLLWIAGLV